MPFTPFHWGPTSCIGFLFFRIFDLPALLVASTVIDFEPLCVLVFRLNYPLHGVFHTFAGSSVLAVLTAVILYFLREKIKKIMAIFRLQQDSSFKKMFMSSFLGIYFHILLDSFLCTDIKPFCPFEVNPLYGLVSPWDVHLFCGVSYLAALLLYVVRLSTTKDSELEEGST
jgi:membrane-bound metal-dependent hydrolase YbcI (DUF457 family)